MIYKTIEHKKKVKRITILQNFQDFDFIKNNNLLKWLNLYVYTECKQIRYLFRYQINEDISSQLQLFLVTMPTFLLTILSVATCSNYFFFYTRLTSGLLLCICQGKINSAYS